MKTIGENIKRIRLEKDITQAELAEAVEVSQSMLCQIERGSKVPSLPLGEQIAEVLQCSIDDLVDKSA